MLDVTRASSEYGNSLTISTLIKACQSITHFLCSIAFEKEETQEIVREREMLHFPWW